MATEVALKLCDKGDRAECFRYRKGYSDYVRFTGHGVEVRHGTGTIEFILASSGKFAEPIEEGDLIVHLPSVCNWLVDLVDRSIQ